MASRGTFLEKKILMLDKRLTQVEKFIELRFSKSEDTGTSYLVGSISGEGEEAQTANDDEGEDHSGLRKNSPVKHTTATAIAKKVGKLAKLEVRDTEKIGSGKGSSSQSQKKVVNPGKDKKVTVTVRIKKPKTDGTVAPTAVEEGVGGESGGRVTRNSKLKKGGKSSEKVSSASVSSPSTSTSGVIKEVIVNDYQKPRYNIRSSRRRGGGNLEESKLLEDNETEKDLIQPEIAEADPLENEEEQSDNDDAEAVSSPETITGDIEEEVEVEEESYFMFPETQNEGLGATAKLTESAGTGETPVEDNITADDVDPDISDPTNENQDEVEEEKKPEPAIPKLKRKRPGKKDTSSTKLEEKRPSKKLKRGRPPNPNPVPKPLKKYPRKYPSATGVTLPKDCIARADPTKKECPMCHQHIKDEYYSSHLETHMKERHLKCPHCDHRYFNAANLRKHMRIHEPEKYARGCRLCKREFLQVGKLLAHERFCVKKSLENGETVDQELLEDIRRRSGRFWNLNEVIPKQKVDPTERKKCPECSRTMKAIHYERHLKTHSNPRNWACNMCTKAYYHKNDLKRHIATDHVSVPCEFCAVMFNNRSELKAHRKQCPKKVTRKRESVLTTTSSAISPSISEDKTGEAGDGQESEEGTQIEIHVEGTIINSPQPPEADQTKVDEESTVIQFIPPAPGTPIPPSPVRTEEVYSNDFDSPGTGGITLVLVRDTDIDTIN